MTFATKLLAAASAYAPETWFHIIDGNASKEGIAADIQAIAEAGIGGIQCFHGGWGGDVWPGVKEPIPCLSEKWVERKTWALGGPKAWSAYVDAGLYGPVALRVVK